LAKRSVYCLCKNTYIIEELCVCEKYRFSAWKSSCCGSNGTVGGGQGIGQNRAAISSPITYHFEDGVNYIFEDGVNYIF